MTKLTLKRDYYTHDRTMGRLYVDNQFFCYTLEDTVRGENIKLSGITAIPAGMYSIKVTFSPRFKRPMPLVYNTPDEQLINNGIRFSGVRLHGGNRPENTDGCILTAYQQDRKEGVIWNTAEHDLTDRLHGKHHIVIHIINEPFER